jgi:hypothetical protein
MRVASYRDQATEGKIQKCEVGKGIDYFGGVAGKIVILGDISGLRLEAGTYR